MTTPRPTLKLPVTLVAPESRRRQSHSWLWQCAKCPYCGWKHTHGGGSAEDDPRKLLSLRVSHCGDVATRAVFYVLEDADPVGTERLIASRKK